MISAAESIIKSNSSIESVHILDQIPRFDPQTSDPTNFRPKLSIYWNNVLRQERIKSPLKDHISIHSHSLPTSPLNSLYAHPYQRHHDGVHLNGLKGSKIFTMSLCNIFQNVFNKHARSSHNHELPVSKNIDNPVPTPKPATKRHFPAAKVTSSKPDSVVIDIDLPHQPYSKDPLIPMYSVPTANFYHILGNWALTTVLASKLHFIVTFVTILTLKKKIHLEELN